MLICQGFRVDFLPHLVHRSRLKGHCPTGLYRTRPLVSPKFARVPREGSRVQGWESVCLGVVVLWFIGFRFLVFCGFKLSKFIGSKVWKNRKFQLFFVKYIGSRLPNFHLIFSRRCWSLIRDVQDSIRRIVGICRRPSFPFPKCSISEL